jgi:hypothetical protein
MSLLTTGLSMAVDAAMLPLALGAGTAAGYALLLGRGRPGRAWRIAAAGALTSIIHLVGLLTGLWVEGSLLGYGAMVATSALLAVGLLR